MDYFNEIINLSKRLVSHESVYGVGGISEDAAFGRNIRECLEEMLAYCRANGFKVYMDPEGKYAYAETGQADDYIAILTHLDVVASGDVSQWDHNPFEAQVIDDKLVGRGVADDKVPAAIAVVSVKKMIDEGVSLKYPIRIIFGGDEETGFRGIEKYKKVHKEPKYTLVMDGTFPFSFSEKHLLNYEIHTFSELNVAGGVGYNSVMDYVKWLKNNQAIEVEGKSAHASRPNFGENALVKLSYLHENEDVLFKTVTEMLHASGHHKISFLEKDLSDKTTLSIGIVKDGVIYVDMRVPPEADLSKFQKDFEKWIKGMGIKPVRRDVMEGSLTDTSSEFANLVLKCYREQTGDLESQPFTSGSATYGRSFKNNCLSFGPRMGYHITNTHKPNEFIPFDLIHNAFGIYVHTLRTIEEEL